MNSIIVNFGSVARYGVAVFLAAFAFFSGFCEPFYDGEGIQIGTFYCLPYGDPYQGADGKWYVRMSCAGSQQFDITSELFSGTNSYPFGSCTNCVQMTPAACEYLKMTFEGYAGDLRSYGENCLYEITNILWRLDFLDSEVNRVYDEGRNLPYFKSSISIPGGSLSEQSELLLSFYGDYIVTKKVATISGTLNNQITQSHCVYNYYNQSVAPMIEAAQSASTEIRYRANSLKGMAESAVASSDSVLSSVESISCEPCQLGSSGGGGGGGGGGTTSGECQALEAAQRVIEFLRSYLDDLQENVRKIKTDVLKISDQVLPAIHKDLAFISTNLLYATEYKTLDGVDFQMRQLDELLKQNQNQGFDFGEFGNLSWFSRVEYLLLSIAGVYSRTNDLGGVTKQKLDDTYDGIAGRESSLANSVDSVSTKFESVHTSLKGFYSSFKTGIGTGNSSGTIRFFSDWIGDNALEIQLDSTLIDGCRACTSLVWTVGFALLLYEILFWGWKFLATAVWFWVRGTTAFVK